MKIGFDGKRAVSNMTGLGNYSRLVIERLAKEFPVDSFYVYTPKLGHNPRLEAILDLHNVDFRLPPPMGFKGSIWRTYGIPGNLRADGIDIFHGLSNELPLNIKSAHIPSVVTIHDVIYRRLPYCYKPIDRAIYDYKYGKSCQNATRIIAISECTKKDIMEFYGVPEDKIDVIYQGCDDSFRRKWSAEELKELRTRLHLPERYLVQVGTIEKRKNLELSIRALSALKDPIPLVVIGRDHHGYLSFVKRLAEELGVTDRVLFIDRVDFKDLPGVYQGAEVILYPSRYEGFGLPVIEGIESNRPVIAATGSCLEEAGGEKTIYVSPDSPHEMKEALEALLSKAINIDDIVESGKRHVAQFNTSLMTENIMKTYQAAKMSFSSK